MNSLQKALVESGLAKEPKKRKHHSRTRTKCHKCGEYMIIPQGTNILVCPNCESRSYFILDKKKK